jgi:hypothetical protein
MRSRRGHAQECSDPPQGMRDSKADYLAILSIHKLVSRRLLRNKLPSSNSGGPHEPSVLLHQKLKPQSHGGSLVENVG